MSEAPWSQYDQAYKRLHDKLTEILAQLSTVKDASEYLPVRLSDGSSFAKSFKTAPINVTASGDQTVVAAVQGKRIKAYAVVLNAGGSVSLKWKSATTDLTGAMPLDAREGYTVATAPPAFVLATGAGEALVLNLSAAVNAAGWVAYWDDDAV